ncbi:hypothetical protein SteCoe_20173 [Stentor coeruleus]|uniref:Uncharacterized protein n=1 Tax=Stentor coeruleus TaxID=5963 RepID=A0A1R2BSL2_9CILI|nr:hypothetical protein SteCoe_20173 [Stentor coeruleus]
MGCAIKCSAKSVNHPQATPIRNKNKDIRPLSTISEDNSTTCISMKHIHVRPCIKLNFKYDNDNNLSDIEFIFSCSISCADQLKRIFEMNAGFFSAFRYFETLIHGACIPKFSILKGFKVMLIYLRLNFADFDDIVIMSEKFPFFSINLGQVKDKIVEAWNEIMFLIKSVYKDKELYEDYLHVQYLSKVIWEISESIKENSMQKAVFIIEKNLNEMDNIYDITKNTVRMFKEFYMVYENEKNKIFSLLPMLAEQEDHSPWNIVHLIEAESNRLRIL